MKNLGIIGQLLHDGHKATATQSDWWNYLPKLYAQLIQNQKTTRFSFIIFHLLSQHNSLHNYHSSFNFISQGYTPPGNKTS